MRRQQIRGLMRAAFRSTEGSSPVPPTQEGEGPAQEPLPPEHPSHSQRFCSDLTTSQRPLSNTLSWGFGFNTRIWGTQTFRPQQCQQSRASCPTPPVALGTRTHPGTRAGQPRISLSGVSWVPGDSPPPCHPLLPSRPLCQVSGRPCQQMQLTDISLAHSVSVHPAIKR